MAITSLPPFIQEHYEIHEWKHPIAILQMDFPDEYNEIITALSNFRLKKTHVVLPGGQKSRVAAALDCELLQMGWSETGFDTRLVVDDKELITPTHKVDCFKNRVALEVEWNNKDPFFDRDLNNFRLLYDYDAISVGIIITRTDELNDLFAELARTVDPSIKKKYGASTTHMGKLRPRVEGGGSAGCPVLVIGIKPNLYEEDVDDETAKQLLAEHRRRRSGESEDDVTDIDDQEEFELVEG